MESKNLNIRDAHIFWTNFSGKARQNNPEGKRNFCVYIEDDNVAQLLMRDGWNVKMDERDPENPKPFINVKVNFDNRPPKIIQVSSEGKNKLTEQTVGNLDWADIVKVDLSISPYRYDVNGKTGVSAYLKNMYVTIEDDPFAEEYGMCATDDEEGFAEEVDDGVIPL